MTITLLWHSMRALSGVTTAVRLLHDALKAQGLTTHVVELEPDGDKSGANEFAGSVLTQSPRPWHTPRAYHQAVIDAISSTRPNVVICNDQRGWRYLQSVSPHVPIVNVVHNDPVDLEYWSEIDWGLRYCSLMLAVSPRIRDRIAALPHARSCRIEVIPYGLPPTAVSPHEPRPAPLTIIFAGRLTQKQKRVRDLPEYMAHLNRYYPDAELIVAGGGSERRWLEQELAWLGPRVRFLGSIDHDGLANAYRRSHFIFVPSAYEGGPLVTIEAMREGVVPIASRIDCASVRALTNGVDCALFEVGDTATAATLTASHWPTWPMLSRNARATSETAFSSRAMTDALMPLLAELDGRRLPRRVRFIDTGYGMRGVVARTIVPLALYTRVFGGVL